MVFKRYLGSLHKVFEAFSGKHVLPGDERWMGFDEFIDLLETSGLISDRFPKQSARPCFVQSTMTVVNEMTTTAYTEMHFVEFLEMVRFLYLGIDTLV